MGLILPEAPHCHSPAKVPRPGGCFESPVSPIPTLSFRTRPYSVYALFSSCVRVVYFLHFCQLPCISRRVERPTLIQPTTFKTAFSSGRGILARWAWMTVPDGRKLSTFGECYSAKDFECAAHTQDGERSHHISWRNVNQKCRDRKVYHVISVLCHLFSFRPFSMAVSTVRNACWSVVSLLRCWFSNNCLSCRTYKREQQFGPVMDELLG